MPKNTKQRPQTPRFLAVTPNSANTQNPSITVYSDRNMQTQLYTLKFLRALSGRGQSGFAAFYADDQGNCYLIKIDDPATCVLEGTASFAVDLVLPSNPDAINFATVGVLKRNGTTSAVSIQKEVSAEQPHTIKPWDTLVYGAKRNPNAWISYESRYQNTIQKHISTLGEKAQWDLAVALFISTMVGDESLHLGQFMAKADRQGQVVGITRIDFGARERYVAARAKNNDFKHKTSTFYANSGQWGKNYISYLLNNPDLGLKYLALWSRTMDIDAIATKHTKLLAEAIDTLPEKLQQKAVPGIAKTLYKGSKRHHGAVTALPFDKCKTAVTECLQTVSKQRITDLQQQARDALLLDITNAYKAMDRKYAAPGEELIHDLIYGSDSNTADTLENLNKHLAQQLQQEDPGIAKHFHIITKTLITRQKLAAYADIPPMEKEKIIVQVITLQKIDLVFQMLAAINEHQKYLASLTPTSSVKAKLCMLKTATDTLKEHTSPQTIFTEEFHDTFLKQKSINRRSTNSMFTVFSNPTPSPGTKLSTKIKKLVQEFNKITDQKTGKNDTEFSSMLFETAKKQALQNISVNLCASISLK